MEYSEHLTSSIARLPAPNHCQCQTNYAKRQFNWKLIFFSQLAVFILIMETQVSSRLTYIFKLLDYSVRERMKVRNHYIRAILNIHAYYILLYTCYSFKYYSCLMLFYVMNYLIFLFLLFFFFFFWLSINMI